MIYIIIIIFNYIAILIFNCQKFLPIVSIAPKNKLNYARHRYIYTNSQYLIVRRLYYNIKLIFNCTTFFVQFN